MNSSMARGQYARRAIAEAKQRSRWSVTGWVTKIYYLELLHASKGTLNCPSCKEGWRQAVKIIDKSLSHNKYKYLT
jgi:hypothetical protein